MSEKPDHDFAETGFHAITGHLHAAGAAGPRKIGRPIMDLHQQCELDSLDNIT